MLRHHHCFLARSNCCRLLIMRSSFVPTHRRKGKTYRGWVVSSEYIWSALSNIPLTCRSYFFIRLLIPTKDIRQCAPSWVTFVHPLSRFDHSTHLCFHLHVLSYSKLKQGLWRRTEEPKISITMMISTIVWVRVEGEVDDYGYKGLGLESVGAYRKVLGGASLIGKCIISLLSQYFAWRHCLEKSPSPYSSVDAISSSFSILSHSNFCSSFPYISPLSISLCHRLHSLKISILPFSSCSIFG